MFFNFQGTKAELREHMKSHIKQHLDLAVDQISNNKTRITREMTGLEKNTSLKIEELRNNISLTIEELEARTFRKIKEVENISTKTGAIVNHANVRIRNFSK